MIPMAFRNHYRFAGVILAICRFNVRHRHCRIGRITLKEQA